MIKFNQINFLPIVFVRLMTNTIDDELLARALQEEEFRNSPCCSEDVMPARLMNEKRTSTTAKTEQDPNPDLHQSFLHFNELYFESKLSGCEVRWSERMTRCAGMCYYYRGGYCSIRLSEPLLKFRPRQDFINTLLHEMIHAFLFVTNNNTDRDGHGPNFLELADKINAHSGSKITVYHTFHEEVNHYRG